jgi:hypothetical protein
MYVAAESAQLRLKRERKEQQNERELKWRVTGRWMSEEVDGLDVIGASQLAAGAGRNRWEERGEGVDRRGGWGRRGGGGWTWRKRISFSRWSAVADAAPEIKKQENKT